MADQLLQTNSFMILKKI